MIWWRIFQKIGKSAFCVTGKDFIIFLYHKGEKSMFHEEGWHHEEISSLTGE